MTIKHTFQNKSTSLLSKAAMKTHPNPIRVITLTITLTMPMASSYFCSALAAQASGLTRPESSHIAEQIEIASSGDPRAKISQRSLLSNHLYESHQL